MKTKTRKAASGKYRIDRPPVRIYVPVDELGPAGARARLGDAVEKATEEVEEFGAARVYEYRLVDRRARARVTKGSGARR